MTDTPAGSAPPDPPGTAPPSPEPAAGPASVGAEAGSADPSGLSDTAPSPGPAGSVAVDREAEGAPPPDPAPPGPGAAAGDADLGKLLLSAGISAARALLRQAVCAAPAAAEDQKGALEADARLWADITPTALRLDFVDAAGRPVAARAFMRECKRPHDLSAELAKVQTGGSVPQLVLARLSGLLFTVRRTYEVVAGTMRSHLLKLYGPAAPEWLWRPRVDPADSTLYLAEDWPLRVGIVIELDEEASSEHDPR